MSDIDIRYPNPLGLQKARAAVEQIARKLSEQFGVDYQWVGDALSFERSVQFLRQQLSGCSARAAADAPN